MTRERRHVVGQEDTAFVVGTPPSEEQAATATATPTESEVNAFIQKLQAFHDSLPGDQHQFVDALVAKVSGKEAEVEGYHGRLLFSFWPFSLDDLRRWGDQCSAQQGHLHLLLPQVKYECRHVAEYQVMRTIRLP